MAERGKSFSAATHGGRRPYAPQTLKVSACCVHFLNQIYNREWTRMNANTGKEEGV
jgi:hypothetical protein